VSDVAAQLITIETDDGPMPAHIWQPAGETGPGLVLLHEVFGVSGYIKDRGRDLAALGYVVCAPEIYWRLSEPAIDEDTPGALERAVSVAQRVDWEAAVGDVRDTLSHLRGMIEVEGGIGLVGFCLGGGLAFNVAAVDDVDVLVSYYGSAIPDLIDLAGEVSAPSLHHWGLADVFIPGETIRRIEAAVTSYGGRFETYPGANHAFDNPSPQFHHPAASGRAWHVTAAFLNEHLPA
jgi:carboxymethylenebutenolidase